MARNPKFRGGRQVTDAKNVSREPPVVRTYPDDTTPGQMLDGSVEPVIIGSIDSYGVYRRGDVDTRKSKKNRRAHR